MLGKIILALSLVIGINAMAQTSPDDKSFQAMSKVPIDPDQPMQMVNGSAITAEQVIPVAADIKEWLAKYLTLNVDMNDVLANVVGARQELIAAINKNLAQEQAPLINDDATLKIGFPKILTSEQASYLGVQMDDTNATFCFPCSVDGTNPKWGVVKK